METCASNERVELRSDPFRTIQIHPTRKCNLSCLHCYSSSAPHLKGMLDINALKKFLPYAFAHGYNNISISGGEPFMYTELAELLIYSKSLGFQNTVASNGMLLLSERNKRILNYIDLIAISVDGPRELHDHIRGQIGAFDKMLNGIELLKKLEKPFGFIHTVTPQSWTSLIWLGEFAHDHGAKLLQLHPLEMYGRALEELTNMAIDDTLAHQTFILANYLRSKYAETMVVQLDLLHRDYIESFPQIVNTFVGKCSSRKKISDIFDTIIIEETGKLLPFAYGFESSLAIGNINNFSNSLFEEYLHEKIPVIESLFNHTYQNIIKNKEVDIANWNELIVNNSKKIVFEGSLID